MEGIRGADRTEVLESLNIGSPVPIEAERHVVFTDDAVPLVMLRRRAACLQPPQAACLLVHDLGGGRESWHRPERSFAGWLANRGFDVFVPELRGHGLSREAGAPLPQRFGDFCDLDGPALIRAVRRLTQKTDLFWIGGGLGGTVGCCVGSGARELSGIVVIGGISSFDGAAVSYSERLAALRTPLLILAHHKGPPDAGALIIDRAASADKMRKVFRGVQGNCAMPAEDEHAPRSMWPLLREWMSVRTP